VFFGVWIFVVFKLQADDGVWTLFGSKELLDAEDLEKQAEEAISSMVVVVEGGGGGSSSSPEGNKRQSVVKVAPAPAEVV